jgi:ethanolamine utilization protein EutA
MDQDRRHTLADHALGALFGHSHHDHDHDHDHDEAFAQPGETSSRPLVSLGLDIGSSSTQAVVSRLTANGVGRFSQAQILYASPIMATPFHAGGTLDDAALWRMVERVFSESGVGPDDIDTGAVILTGAAAERRNAAAVADQLSQAVGDLVCTAAGDHMEARLAAFGSGAVAASQAGDGRRILLVDVGGATTKLAVVERGEVLATAALAVGGRLMVVDARDRIIRLEPRGAEHARRAGFAWALGEDIPPNGRDEVARRMACLIAEAVGEVMAGTPPSPAIAKVLLTEPLAIVGGIDAVMVSGGVAEYVYGHEKRDFGDLGRPLGLALRVQLERLGRPLQEPTERIRATVLGASRYAVQMSGDTVYLSSHARLLPRRNLSVAFVPFDFSGAVSPGAVADAIRVRLSENDGSDQIKALAFAWGGEPSYKRLRAFAEGLVAGLGAPVATAGPLYILLEGDAAANLGAILKEDLAVSSDVLVLDGIKVGDFDYLDLGRIRLPSRTVPVTVKSLLFGGVG